MAKRQLADMGVPYEEVDIEEHPEEGLKIERHTGGYRTVPTFEIDGQLYVNPNRGELERAVRG
jgi:glutaredoxin